MNPKEMFAEVDTVLVIDWPSKEVPEALTLAGVRGIVRGGSGPEEYSVYELNNDEVVVRHLGRPAGNADLIYSYRPVSELPEIVATAKGFPAKTTWTQSGLSAARVKDKRGCWVPEEGAAVGSKHHAISGLDHITQRYIGDVAREIRESC